MNTNAIKAFAKAARLKLLDGVESRLKYWGINENAAVVEEPEATYGGYIFRGKVFTGTTAMDKWKRLQSKIKDKQAVKDVIEEAAYIWFNRLMAMKILEKNGYIPLTIGYENSNKTPAIVQEAKKGNYKPVKNSDKQNLLEYLDENKEEKAFGLLITDFCNKHPLLKEVFGRINDYTELLIPNNLLVNDGLIEMINTTEAITDEDYKQVELIGWLYQFYISDRKDEVFAGFKNNKKARPEDIPAATQIFTPKWIVKYMVENTVGKIWLDYNPDSPIREEMKYLVENEDGKNNEPIISGITELTLMDPACGSGHILVEGFDLLMKMYLEEGYTKKNAAISILENNLYGLEIDDRAAQLARFALLLKAASYYPEIINLPLSKTKKEGCNIHAFPEPTTFTTDELLTVIGQEGRPFLDEIKEALDLLQQGKNIGSALKLNLSEEVLKFIEELLRKDHSSLVWQMLKPFPEIINALTRKYHAVVTNPPYLGYKVYNHYQKEYFEINYPTTKNDLFAIFQEIISQLGIKLAKRGIINQWAWMCIDSYKYYRDYFLRHYRICSLLHLGIGVFKELNTKKVQNVALIFEDLVSIDETSVCFKLDETFILEEKEKVFLSGRNKIIKRLNKLLKVPGSPLAFWLNSTIINSYSAEPIFDEVISPRQGLATGDNNRFVRYWFEISVKNISTNSKDKIEALRSNKKWFPYNKGGGYKKWYGNEYYIVNWENDGHEIKNNYDENGRLKSRPQNTSYYFKEGITWSLISLNFSARYSELGHIFDVGGSSGFPNSTDLLYSIALLNSKVSSYLLQALNFTLNVQVGDIKRILFITPNNEQKSQIEKASNRLIELARFDFDSNELSRDFLSNNLITQNKSNIKQSLKNFKSVIKNSFIEFANLELKVNQNLIKLYSLEKQLTPNPEIKYLTLFRDYINESSISNINDFEQLSQENICVKSQVLLEELMSYFMGLILGRYRLDKPGLNIAHPNPTEEELSSYSYNSHKVEIDDDAIIPFMGSESAFPDDVVSRVKNLLIAIWGEETLTENLNFFRECLGMDMERWLTEKFWAFHVRMYKKRPIYWLFASNPKYPQAAAFKVLVYMHRMDKYTVQKIRNNYLHPHQGWIKREIEKLKEDEASLSREDQKHLTKLQQFELECSDYDEILKDLANRQIEIDLDDGVKVNIEKFELAAANI